MLHVINSFQWRRAHRFRFLFGMAFCCRLVHSVADRRGTPKHIKGAPLCCLWKPLRRRANNATDEYLLGPLHCRHSKTSMDCQATSFFVQISILFCFDSRRLLEWQANHSTRLHSPAPLHRYLQNVMKTLWFRSEMSRQMEFLLFGASVISLCVFLACARKLPIKKVTKHSFSPVRSHRQHTRQLLIRKVCCLLLPHISSAVCGRTARLDGKQVFDEFLMSFEKSQRKCHATKESGAQSLCKLLALCSFYRI